MKKEFRIIIIVLCAALLGTFAFVSCGGNEEENLDGATFSNVPGDLLVDYGDMIPLEINIPDGVKKVELFYNDSLFQTYQGQKGKKTFSLVAYYYGIGTYTAILRTHFNDGTQQDEILRIQVKSEITPTDYTIEIVKSYPHNTESYTQGLEFNNGQLYEGTGDPGQQGKTLLAKVDLNTGAFGTKIGLGDPKYFGEGITILGDKLYQLTWQNGECFVYDKNTLQLDKKSFRYSGQGWGLCNDGKQLIMSDGTERLYFRDPKTFAVLRSVEVFDNVGPKPNLNELEYIDGKIYANIYQTNTVIVIDPRNGKVLEEINCSLLELEGRNGGDVLNGIAYNPATKKLYMTGKYWNKVFEVRKKPL